MSMANASTFKVALIQMRSGLEPEANLAAVLAGVDEAKSGGADYVQTPEMTNVLENKRERLLTKIFDEEQDPTLATLREVARKLSIYIHLGSLAVKASPEKAANRAFLIDRNGDIAARYDKIHMFDVDLANGESYRESNSYRPGELGVVADLPWGRLGLSVCYDLRFPALHRERLLRVRRCPRRQARAWPRDLRPFAGGRPVGQDHRRGRHRAGRDLRRDRPGAGRGGARARAITAPRPAFRDGRAAGGADVSARRAGLGMIRYALRC